MDTRRKRRDGRRYFPRRKVCSFCVDKVKHIDYKDVDALRRFMSDWAKIESRRKSGTCAPHQRALTRAIKRAREVALLPYTGGHSLIEMGRGSGFRGRRDRPMGRPRTTEIQAPVLVGARPPAVAPDAAADAAVAIAPPAADVADTSTQDQVTADADAIEAPIASEQAAEAPEPEPDVEAPSSDDPEAEPSTST